MNRDFIGAGTFIVGIACVDFSVVTDSCQCFGRCR